MGVILVSVSNEPYRIWMEVVVVKSGYDLGICLEELRKTMETFSQDSVFPCRDSSQRPAEYKSIALRIEETDRFETAV
jgi:hypothetical protein